MNRKQPLRILLIFLFVGLVFLGFSLQNSFLSNYFQSQESTRTIKEQIPLVAKFTNDKGLWVALTRLKNQNPYLVLYKVGQDYKFAAASVKEINQPIDRMFFEQDNFVLWTHNENGWEAYDQSLTNMENLDSVNMPDEQLIFDVIETSDSEFQTSILYKEEKFNYTFEEKPVGLVKLNDKENMWLILFEEFDTKMVHLEPME